MLLSLLVAAACTGMALGGSWLYLASLEGRAAETRLRREWSRSEVQLGMLLQLRQGYLRSALGRWVDSQLQAAYVTLPAADVTVGCVLLWGLLIKVGSSALGLTLGNATVVATLTVTIASRLYLKSRRGWLVRTFNDQLPEVTWMMGNAMRAGLTIAQGLALVAREAPKPAGPIFQEMLAQLDLKAPLTDVLAEAQVKWSESREFRLVILTMLIQYRSGGNLAGALEELSRTLAERKGVNEEVQSATAGPRSAAAILPFMPVIAAATMNMAIPGFLNPIFSWWGLLLIVPFAVVMWLTNIAIRQFSNIKV